MKKSLKFLLLASCVCLTACAGGGLPIDNRTFLGMQDGPDVPTVEGNFLKSAKLAEEQGDFAKAGQFYANLIDRNPSNVEYKLNFARVMRQTGDFDRSIGIYNDVLNSQSNNVDALEGKALALIAAGNYSEAGQYLSQVMAQDSQRWRTLNAFGILFSMKNLRKEALEYFEEALKYDEDNPIIINNIALTFAMEKRFDVAIKAMRKGVKRAKRADVKKHVELNLALLYGITSDFDSAREILTKYFPESAVNNNLGLYAHLADNEVLSQSYLNMALTRSKVHYEKAWKNLEKVVKSSN